MSHTSSQEDEDSDQESDLDENVKKLTQEVARIQEQMETFVTKKQHKAKLKQLEEELVE